MSKNTVESKLDVVSAEQALTTAVDPQTRWYAEQAKTHPDKYVIVVSVDEQGSIRTRSNCTMETIARILSSAAEQFIYAVENAKNPETKKKMN